jgi:general secretion pathway protein A
MYEKFFGLRERPFDLTPNPRFLYLTPKHREALGNLQYGITAAKGITLLVGEAGTGKTTVVRAALDRLAGPSVRCVFVSNPTLLRSEFYQLLAEKLELSASAGGSKAVFLSELEAVLAEQARQGRTTALVIDEAQSLPDDLMEEVRLLANLETPTRKLLPVVLAGQPELAERLEEEELRQLKQRVALRCELTPLNVRETAAYIAGRVAIAGGEAPRIFTREAVQAIHEWSQGIPRTISVLCDNTLVTGFAVGEKPVGTRIVLDVARDFRLKSQTAAPAAPAASVATENQRGLLEVQGVPGNGHQPVLEKMAKPLAEAASKPALPMPKAVVVRREERADAPVAVPRAAAPVGAAKPGAEIFAAFSKRKRFKFF